MANRAEMMDTENRLFNFYLKRSFTPGEALSMAKQEMERRAEEEVRNQQFYQKNPRDLDSTRSELPNYSETANELPARDRVQFDPVTGSIVMPSAPATRYSTPSGNNIVRFSNPMTEEETNIARESLPIPRPGNAQDYGERPSANQPGIIDRALLAVGLPTHVRIPSFGGASAASPAQRYAESTMREDQGGSPPAAAAAAAQPSTAPAFPMDGSISGETYGTPNQRELARAATQVSGLMDSGQGITAPAAAARPVARRELTQPSRVVEAPRGETASLLSRIFGGGPEYQSTGDLVVKKGGQGVNFGSGESAADFFRADKALRAQRPEMFERQAEARGGAPKAAAGNGGKDAALHKALEIIHHLLTRGR